MEIEEITKEIGSYPEKTIFNITWGRGNGDLSASYVSMGFKDGAPILKRYEEGKDLSSHFESPSFDIFNKDIHVKNIEVSVEYLGPF